MRACLMKLGGLVFLIACARGERDASTDTTRLDSAAAATTPDPAATAVIRDSAGRDLGTLTLSSSNDGIVITGRLVGLPPGEHGIHVHAVGRCDPPTFESAGDHWNPTNRQHGAQNPQGPHLGDVPNVTAGADSVANVQLSMTSGGSLRLGANMVLDTDGSAVVIHSGPDDYRTDPSGGSGARIACGVVASP